MVSLSCILKGTRHETICHPDHRRNPVFTDSIERLAHDTGLDAEVLHPVCLASRQVAGEGGTADVYFVPFESNAFPVLRGSLLPDHPEQAGIGLRRHFTAAGQDPYDAVQWERRDATCLRVMQHDWDAPRCADWVARLDQTMRIMLGQFVLVAHSSACAMVAHWVLQADPADLARVRGALLVAPSDPTAPAYPLGPTGFSPVPLHPLPFRSIVVTSDKGLAGSLNSGVIRRA